jgi:hypothetical protein
VFAIENCHLIVKELELGFGERFLFSFGKTSSLSLCALVFVGLFIFFGFVVAVSLSPLLSFCFRKANPAHTRVPQERRDRGSEKGKLNGRFYFFLATVSDPDSRLAVLFWDCEEGKKGGSVGRNLIFFFGGVGVSSRRNRFKESI